MGEFRLYAIDNTGLKSLNSATNQSNDKVKLQIYYRQIIKAFECDKNQKEEKKKSDQSTKSSFSNNPIIRDMKLSIYIYYYTSCNTVLKQSKFGTWMKTCKLQSAPIDRSSSTHDLAPLAKAMWRGMPLCILRMFTSTPAIRITYSKHKKTELS